MKAQVWRASVLVLLFLLCIVPCSATFTLDPTFAGGGRLTIAFPDSSTGYSSTGRRVFVQPSGRILAAGTFTWGTPDGQMLGVTTAGLTTGGVVDQSFSPTFAWQSNGFTSLNDTLMYSDGSTLRLMGFFNVGGSSTVSLARSNVDGVGDSVFNSNAQIGPGPSQFGTARGAQVAVRSDGKVLALIVEQGQFFLYRLNANGTRDTTFGTNGVLPITFNKMAPQPSDGWIRMNVLADGKILLVGNITPLSFPNGSSDFFLARLSASGNWDKTFGRSGFMTLPFGPGMTGWIDDAIVQPDGQILLSGGVVNGDLDTWMMRLRSNGRVDTSFGTNGVVIRDFSSAQTDRARAVALSADGKIRIAGSLGATPNFLVARFSANGTFEEHTSVEFTSGQYANAYDITLQPDGKLLVLGETRNPNMGATTGSVFAIARLTE